MHSQGSVLFTAGRYSSLLHAAGSEAGSDEYRPGCCTRCVLRLGMLVLQQLFRRARRINIKMICKRVEI